MKCPDPAKLSRYYESGLAEDFEAFVLNSEPWIFKRARYLIRGSVPGKFELAEDVTWTVLRKVEISRLWKPWVPAKGTLGGWLFRMIRNQVVSHLRVKANRVRPCSDFQCESEEGRICSMEQRLYDDRTELPQEAMIRAEQLQRVKGLLEQLPAETKRVVTLYYDEELTYREIALEIGSNPTSVYRQVAAVRAQVARLASAGPIAA